MKHLKSLLILTLSLIITSCSSDEPSPNGGSASRTVLVYMVASNSLSGYADRDINEMMDGIAEVENRNCHLLLYETTYDEYPVLYEIKNSNGKATKNVIKTYASDIRSTTVQRMSEVMSDTQKYAPAESYGLVLWSHASGWVRTLEQESIRISPKDYGDDYGHSMSITDLASALPDGMFDFIYADVCYMGCIEIAYQLRDKTDYYISSPTEMMATGMPYDKNTPCFFEKTPNLVKACRNTYEHYASSGSYVTISLVDCSKLDTIAGLCRQIHANPGGGTTVPIDELQSYNRNSKSVFFDFLQYTSLLAVGQQADDLYKLTNDAVIYKAATPTFLSLAIDPDHYSGLSTYILGTASRINEQYYTTLDWYKDIY